MRDVAILGRDHIKVDSLDKVLGRAKFAADYYMPDMLYGGVFRSTVPHAYIKKLNLEKARASVFYKKESIQGVYKHLFADVLRKLNIEEVQGF